MADSYYIASGFFTPLQISQIEELKRTLTEAGCTYYSPKDELVCPPDASSEHMAEVLRVNCEKILDCDAMLANFTDSDMGTLFEVGYALAYNKTVEYSLKNRNLESAVDLAMLNIKDICDSAQVDDSLYVIDTSLKRVDQLLAAGFLYASGSNIVYYCSTLPEGGKFNLMLAQSAFAVCTNMKQLSEALASEFEIPYTGLIE